MGFDTQRAVVATGDGVVARFPGILCVAQGSDPDAVGRLLALCAAVAGPDPGRALARRLVAWMSGPESPGDRLRFGTLAAAGTQLAVFLVGDVEAWVDGPDRTVLSGADAAIGTDRLLPRPDVPVILSVGDIRLPADPADVHDLRSGVVVGAGAVLHPVRAGDILGVLDDVTRSGWDNGVDAEESRHDWFADAASPAEPAVLGTPSLPDGNAPAGATWDTGGWPARRNGLPSGVNGDGGESPAWPWPPGAEPGGERLDAAEALGAVTGRHAIGDPLAPAPPATGSNGHVPPAFPDSAGEPDTPSRPALRVFEGGAAERDAAPDGRPPAGAAEDPSPAPTGSPVTGTAAVDHAAANGRTGSVGATAGTLPPSADGAATAAREPAPAADPANVRKPDDGAAVLLAEEEPVSAGPQVRGFVCDKGHLNDPRAPFCGRCGAAIDDRVGGLVDGPRPALGRLVFDDGAIYTVDEGYLVGRMPEADDRVQVGGLRPIVVEDRSGSVSRVHAEIQVTGWDVMLLDAGSRNGTFVAGPEESGWSPLAPQRSRRLLPGTRVRLGSRTFVFESASGVR